MTYLETLLFIQEHKEVILSQETRAIITDQHRYVRDLDDPESAWRQDTVLGMAKKMYGRGGEYYIWVVLHQEMDDVPVILPEGT